MSIKKEHKGLYLTPPNNHGLQAYLVEEEEEEKRKNTITGVGKILDKLRYKGVKEIIGETKKWKKQ